MTSREASDRARSSSTRRWGTARIVVLAFAIALVLVLVALSAAAWTLLDRPASGASGSAVQIEIKPGSDTRAIALKLESAGVVNSALAFRVGVRVFGADRGLKPGVYDLRTGMSVRSAVDVLKAGPPVVYNTVTIPEGFVVTQIAERFEKQAGIPKDEFTALATSGAAEFADDRPYLLGTYQGSLEGYLFPKTYRIAEGTTAREVIEMMLDQFDTEIAQIDVEQARNRGLNLNQLVTLGSMIERESRLDSERPLVSSVIHNRLATDSYLKIDATVQYVLGNNKFRLSNQDIRIDSPYNTYTHKGLPPGPISNPGLKSLQAAATPAETKLLYYVLTGKDGSHTFTTNLADFLKAKEKSKEVFGE